MRKTVATLSMAACFLISLAGVKDATAQKQPNKQPQRHGIWLDRKTDLMWSIDVTPDGDRCRTLKLGGYADWRDPTVAEMFQLFADHDLKDAYFVLGCVRKKRQASPVTKASARKRFPDE